MVSVPAFPGGHRPTHRFGRGSYLPDESVPGGETLPVRKVLRPAASEWRKSEKGCALLSGRLIHFGQQEGAPGWRRGKE